MYALAALVLWSPLVQIPEGKTISLFDGVSLAGWHMDVPALDGQPDGTKPFIVRDGKLVSLGQPMGHLITDGSYGDYRLTIEYRFSKQAGNSGVIVHVSKPRVINNLLPQGIEAQLMSGNAGDFHMFAESLMSVADPTKRAGKNTTDHSEKPLGEWNTMIVECRADTIKVWVNGDLVNSGVRCSVQRGQIALQSEGSEVEFRKLVLMHFRKQP